MIKSPYYKKTEQEFLKKINKLMKEYGYEYFFITYSERTNKDSSDWHAYSTVICEGMVEYLENIIEMMKDELL